VTAVQITLRPVAGVRITTLMDNSSDVLVPAHCTSWSAMHALAASMPAAFRPNAVGSQFTLGTLS
jgi:7,8-dihydropterin-6-yl-methyl-4-(beta-D-ribofuranosyl)aminobenzene 5'-phosphate synthase